jgi:hypothetical protein
VALRGGLLAFDARPRHRRGRCSEGRASERPTLRLGARSADYRAMDRRFTILLLALAGLFPIGLGIAAGVMRVEALFLLSIFLLVLYAGAALLLRHEDEPAFEEA